MIVSCNHTNRDIPGITAFPGNVYVLNIKPRKWRNGFWMRLGLQKMSITPMFYSSFCIVLLLNSSLCYPFIIVTFSPTKAKRNLKKRRAHNWNFLLTPGEHNILRLQAGDLVTGRFRRGIMGWTRGSVRQWHNCFPRRSSKWWGYFVIKEVRKFQGNTGKNGWIQHKRMY